MTDAKADPATPSKIAVAVSGGGYRASAWGLGVLWCLADTGLNEDVRIVSSVSGGSITNAHVGLGSPYPDATPASFASSGSALAARLSGSPGGFRAALAVTVLAAVAAWVGIGTGGGAVVAIAVAVAVLAALVGAKVSRDVLFGRVEAWLFVDVLLACVGLVVWAWPNALLVVGAVLLLGVVAMLRGPAVGWAMGRSLRTMSGRADQSLAGLNAEPLHVFLATDLRSGHHAAFARGFVYCYDLGIGAKPSLPVRVAVQASSNLPGAFPTRWVRTAGMSFVGGMQKVGWLALSDGGVYDNMADQWPLGLQDRVDRLDADAAVVANPAAAAVLGDWHGRVPDFAIVANASGHFGFRKVGKAALPIVGELLSLLQVKDVLYEDGNSVRRARLIDWFDASSPAGTLIHIASNPYALPNAMVTPGGDPDRLVRANEALAYLAANGGSQEDWKALGKTAQSVGTQLWPLGTAATRSLVRAAYVQTMVNLHMKLGVALHEPPM